MNTTALKLAKRIVRSIDSNSKESFVDKKLRIEHWKREILKIYNEKVKEISVTIDTFLSYKAGYNSAKKAWDKNKKLIAILERYKTALDVSDYLEFKRIIK